MLRLVATGASNKEIAQRLVISPNTVKVHLRNIFEKIGVQSRTEATLYAIQYSYVTSGAISKDSAGLQSQSADGAALSAPASPSLPSIAARRRSLPAVMALLAGFAVVTFALGQSLGLFPPFLVTATPTVPPVTPTAVPEWDPKAPMPTARTGMAVATYSDQIYVIGGETITSTTGAVERYDAQSDRWSALAPMPTPATDIHAAVIGGLIYVPGGRVVSDTIANQLAIYDPRQNRWEQGPSLPEPRSAYGLAAFEGKLYLFGGWDGKRSVNTVYEYSPDQGRWTTCRPLTAARSHSAAAAAGGRMYLVGGEDSQRPLEGVESFSPAGDCMLTTWSAAVPLPSGYDALDAVSLGDILYVFTRQKETLRILTLLPGAKDWAATPLQAEWITPQTRLASAQDKLHLLVGNTSQQAPTNHWAFQIYYSVLIPLITK